MKKILIIITMFFLFLSSFTQNNFSLSDVFVGEYTCFTTEECKDGIDLGFCYQSKNKEKNIIGESMKLDCEPIYILERLHCSVKFTEFVDGLTIIYGYSNLINKNITKDNEIVNVQISFDGVSSVVGWPLILGAY